MQGKITQLSLLRTLDPLFGYGWDVYPKSTLLVLVDALAQGYVEQWEDILDQLMPQETEPWPPAWAVDEIVTSPELVGEFGERIQQLVTWGDGVHWQVVERLSPLLPTTRWLSELMRFKIVQNTCPDRHRAPLTLAANAPGCSSPKGDAYTEQLDSLSVYYGLDLYPKTVAVALLDREIEETLSFWHRGMELSAMDEDFDQEVEQWPTSIDALIPQIADGIEAAFRARFEWAIENGYLLFGQAIGFDADRQHERLVQALRLRLSRWPGFFDLINQAIASHLDIER